MDQFDGCDDAVIQKRGHLGRGQQSQGGPAPFGHARPGSFWDAFFFTTVQLLTVSSQTRNPVTTGGRIVDIALEVWAVVVVAGSAGAVASFFQDDPR